MATQQQTALEARLAALDEPRSAPAPGAPGAEAYARHAEYQASIKAISRQINASITQAPGYHDGLGAIYSPVHSVAFLDGLAVAAQVKRVAA